MTALGVSLFVAAAACGAFLRLLATINLPQASGTFLVNLLGSIAIGFLFVAMEKTAPQWRAVVIVAFLGSLTTYSSFVLDCLHFAQKSQWKLLSLYLFSTHILCFLGCALGWQVAKRWAS